MQLGFATEELRTLCNSGRELRQVFGGDISKIVQRGLWSLDAALSLAHLSPKPPIYLAHVSDGPPLIFSIGQHGHGQIFFSAGEYDSATDLGEIRSVQIFEIGGME